MMAAYDKILALIWAQCKFHFRLVMTLNNHQHTLMKLTSYNKPCVSRSEEVSSYVSGRVNPCIIWLNLRIGDLQLPRHFMPGHRVDEGTWRRNTWIQQTEVICPLQTEISLHWLLRKDSWDELSSRIYLLVMNLLTAL